MARADGYTAVLFDVYGTLLDVHGVADAAERAFPGLGMELSRRWRSKQLEYSWLRTLANRYVSFWQLTGDALDYVAEEMRLDLGATVRAGLMAAYRTLPAFGGAAGLLHDLGRRGIVRAALSNGSPDMLEPALAAAGLRPRLDDVLSVEAVRRFKVAPEAYRLAVDRFGGEASAFLLVSSNGWDVAGATIFGFETYWINRSGSPVERLGVEPTGIGRSLADLSAWIGR